MPARPQRKRSPRCDDRTTLPLARWRRGWRTRWRRRRTGIVAAVLAPRAAAGARNLVTLGIHALHVRTVVPALQLVPGRVRGAIPGTRSDDQSRAGADCRAGSSAADQRAGCGAHHGADCGVAYRAVDCRLFARRSAALVVGVLPALGIIETELIEILRGARKHGHAWARRRCSDATGEQQRSSERCQDPRRVGHQREGCGETRCQPPGHSFTYG